MYVLYIFAHACKAMPLRCELIFKILCEQRSACTGLASNAT